MPYPVGEHLLCNYGLTWNWYCLAKLHGDGTAEILCHGALHRRDDRDRIEHLAKPVGRFCLEEGPQRTATGLQVYSPDPEVHERAWRFDVSNPGHVFWYPRLSEPFAAA